MSTKFEVRKATPVMFVDRVESCVAFWERLGFEKTVEVPHGEGIGFAIVLQGGVELMLQSRGSIADDVPALAAEPSRLALYVEVSDLDEAIRKVAGAPIVFERRRTFYGAQELGVRDPAGNIVTLAQVAAQ